MSTNTRTASEPTHDGVLEVSDIPASRARRYAREAGDVHFERKGGRTFLVADR
jgi:hypothetical protein